MNSDTKSGGPFSRYLVSGSIAVGLHFSLLGFLVELLGINATLATTIGFLLSSLFHYTIQYFWVFSESNRYTHRLLRYTIVTTATAALNAGLVSLFHFTWGLKYLLAQLLVTVLIVLLNYLANRHFTFS